LSNEEVRKAVMGSDALPATDIATAIGKAAKRLDEIADDMAKAKDEDKTRFGELKTEQVAQAAVLNDLKAKAETEANDLALKGAVEAAAEWREFASTFRAPSKAHLIAGGGAPQSGYVKGDFLFGVHEANARDADRQAEGKSILTQIAAKAKASGDAKGFSYESAWGKSTLGTSDATGGWVIPNAIVDEFITPATIDNIYRRICTVVPGVTAFAVDIPFRSAARTRAAVVAFGQTKENLDLAYNGYTATMYTLARIYDIGNQFLRQSRGAAETDVLSELAAAFAQGEAYYVREGSGSSQPYGYTSALTSGPAAFRTTFTPSATTLAGSMAHSIADAAGALAGRGVRPDGAVLSASSYWTMLAQGTDSAGFFFNPASGPTAINALPGTLVSPFGVPVYPDADADLEGTAAVIDNLVVGQWKKFKIYFGESYRVDSSDQAGTRWDTNLTGFRGEEEMGFDARPAVYAGYFQAITDITP
jgi:HK97 family phage major capsid protein